MPRGVKRENDVVPKFHQLLYPTLRALIALGGSGTNEEIHDGVVTDLKLPDAVVNVIHVNQKMTSLAYRLAWARTYLKLFGAIESTTRGVWAISDKGKALKEQDCEQIPATVRKLPTNKKQVVGASLDEEPPAAEGEEWIEQLIDAIKAMKPDAFERLSMRLLRESGFSQVEVTGRSGDDGIDGVGLLKVNLLSFHVLFQCKRYQGSVGARAIRDFRGAMQGRSDKGMVITTGVFTADARKEATRDGAPAIDLIDGEALCYLLKDKRLGVQVEMIEKVAVRSDFFSEI